MASKVLWTLCKLISLSPSVFIWKIEVAVKTYSENVQAQGSAQRRPSLNNCESMLIGGDTFPGTVDPAIWAQHSEGKFCPSRVCLEPKRTQLFADSVFFYLLHESLSSWSEMWDSWEQKLVKLF